MIELTTQTYLFQPEKKTINNYRFEFFYLLNTSVNKNAK